MVSLDVGDATRRHRIVVVMQRVHEADLVGYLLEQGGFEVSNLPAIAQSDASYELGAGGIYTRRKGELLHPAHEPAEVLRDLKKIWGHMHFLRNTSSLLFLPVAGSSRNDGSSDPVS